MRCARAHRAGGALLRRLRAKEQRSLGKRIARITSAPRCARAARARAALIALAAAYRVKDNQISCTA